MFQGRIESRVLIERLGVVIAFPTGVVGLEYRECRSHDQALHDSEPTSNEFRSSRTAGSGLTDERYDPP